MRLIEVLLEHLVAESQFFGMSQISPEGLFRAKLPKGFLCYPSQIA